ncbi:MAG: multicopper oxidase domain-containing protein [Gammaproteobacteria bacterium]
MISKNRLNNVVTLHLFAGILFLLPLIVTAESTTRTYYIAAEEITWNYTSSWPMNPMTGGLFSDDEKKYLEGNGRDRIGYRYRKAVYREYTDESFETLKTRGSEWEHLGLLGPVIRATVGDTIRVVFKNKLENRSASMHPHGLEYAKESEGSTYADGTAGVDRRDENIAPGATHTYTWTVPPRSGPGPADPASVAWLYHSSVNGTADIHAGLVGPIIVTRRFQAREDGSPADVQREFVTLFAVFDENDSFLAERNRNELAPQSDPADTAFRQSNRMHSINGYLYGNLPGLDVNAGDYVRWHVLTPGHGTDIHSPHWHGNGVTAYGRHTDTVSLPPGSRRSVTMEADNPGTWLFHCRAGDHGSRGMSSVFRVTAP